MNKPREGNRPGSNLHIETERDLPEASQPLQRKMESGLAEPKRDSLRNRFLAQRNGWSDAEYFHWVETGDTPVRSTVKETPASRPQEIDDDERLHQWTEVDEAGIYHIDGPPYRGFAVESNGDRVEVIYKTLRYAGTREECEEGYKALLNLFKAEMNDLHEIEVADKKRLALKIIWWRQRVEYMEEPETPGYWRFYCRFATTPDCPLLWERWETEEGALNRNVKEIVG